MPRVIDLDKFKELYVGKTFGWLTVIDVYKDTDKGRYYFKCKCKCGKEVCKQYNKVISGHTSSCGCFKFTKEYSDKLKSVWETKQDVVKDRSKTFSTWCKEHPDKVKEMSEKRKKTIEENPDILVKQIENRKKTLKEHPEIQDGINNKLRSYYANNADARLKLSNIKLNYYKNNPDKVKDLSKRTTKFYKDNPEKRVEASEKAKTWAMNNPDKVAEIGKQHSDILKLKRLSAIQQAYSDDNDQFKIFLEVLHPSYVDDLLSGNIKASDIIRTKCPICGKYETHYFNGTWKIFENRFKTGHPPYCEQCRYSLTKSSLEDEIASYVSTFYNGECIRNSRNVIYPLELDLYYPEKHIAIEYNGSYWHDEDHLPKQYHYNKFRKCLENGILLVSVFEHDWDTIKDLIKNYIKDLFENKNNSLSYISESIINLNYPITDISLDQICNISSNFYIKRGRKIYTCGHANIVSVKDS